jgi:hypothetical protein
MDEQKGGMMRNIAQNVPLIPPLFLVIPVKEAGLLERNTRFCAILLIKPLNRHTFLRYLHRKY